MTTQANQATAKYIVEFWNPITQQSHQDYYRNKDQAVLGWKRMIECVESDPNYACGGYGFSAVYLYGIDIYREKAIGTTALL